MTHAITPRLGQRALQTVARANRAQVVPYRSLHVTHRALEASPGTSVGNVETPGFKSRPDAQGSNSSRIGNFLPVLIGLALLTTGYGVYDYYTSFSTWPPELQEHLRRAITSRNRGDALRSIAQFEKALATARECKPQLNVASSADGSGAGEAMLKISGIAIALASVLENEGQIVAAYNVLEDAWQELMLQAQFKQTLKGEKRTQRDSMRAVSIAQKLGEMGQIPEVRAEVLSKLGADAKRPNLTGTADSQDPAERWLVWSVEELFRIMLPKDLRQRALDAAAAADASEKAAQHTEQVDLTAVARAAALAAPSESEQINLAELDLPPWVSKLDILASVENLGTFYSMHQVPEYAVPLYLQALSILLPKNGSPTVSERCKAALVMNNISQLMSETNVPGATKWATKGLSYVDDTLTKAGFEAAPASNKKAVPSVVQSSEERTQEVKQECLGVRLTLLYNLGVLADMSGDKCQARTYFQKAYMLAEQTGLSAAKRKAADSLAKLERRSSSTRTN